jgi:TRAP-type mannitol/chloroaromatic compound transport system permease small subunit
VELGMDRILDLAYRLARAGAWAGGSLVILASFIIGIDVLLRKFFSVSIGGSSELSGYVLAISSSWAFALALLDRAHIRIDTLYVVLPTRVAAVLDILSLFAMFGFVTLLTWQSWHVFAQSFRFGSHALTPLGTPLAYPQFLWLVGLVFFLLIIVLLSIRACVAFAHNDIATVQRIAGSRTAQEDLDEELDSMQRRGGAHQI